ncbi:GntR family transcriptional regulator [Cohnella endophytica]|uniref:GntR family transcriptional regulator n=1 Tax=Cohnella endophytica TaxID=2419778 RepID=A0A494XQV4_9BACL|nr:GntR family transcriptional regulator [Cohnella endophytica]RKP52998.1 GntR family transcriptional regulator [Cohnella endophytica]
MSSYPYTKIKDDIKKRVLEGEWVGEAKLPSSRDFAQAYQSSVNTVEKAIKELCAEGLLKRDSRRGTFIENGVISPLSQSGSGLVAASVIGIDNPLWGTALRGIEDVLQRHGFHLISYSDDRSLDKLETLVKGAVAKRVDGVILSPILDKKDPQRNERLYELLKNSGIKVVFLDRYLNGSDIPFVASDNGSGAYRLTKKLIERGHRRVLFIRNSNLSTMNERLLGAKQAYLDSGIELAPELDVLIPTEHENFEEEFDDFVSRVAEKIKEHPCTAIFAANDQIAEAALVALDRLGLGVPQDVSLVTYDPLNLNRKLKLDITGVDQPFYEMGRKAAIQLMNLVENKDRLSVWGQLCKAEIHEGSSIAEVKHIITI